MLPSRPRARRRIGTPSEALRAGLERDGESVPRPRPYEPSSSETENRCPIRGLTSWPRVRQRIGTPFEAWWAGPRARPRIGTSSEALRLGPRMSRKTVRGGPGGPAKPRTWWGLASSCPLALIFIGSKRFFRFLLRGPLFMVPNTLNLGHRILNGGWRSD